MVHQMAGPPTRQPRCGAISVAFAILFVSLAPVAFAQDASVVGTVTDESKGVLPGTTVTAREVSSGRTYEDVTNERGEYRLRGMSPGRYELKAQLSGFATVVFSNLEFLVGQHATVPFTLKVAALTESITVTSESPLVDLRPRRWRATWTAARWRTCRSRVATG